MERTHKNRKLFSPRVISLIIFWLAFATGFLYLAERKRYAGLYRIGDYSFPKPTIFQWIINIFITITALSAYFILDTSQDKDKKQEHNSEPSININKTRRIRRVLEFILFCVLVSSVIPSYCWSILLSWNRSEAGQNILLIALFIIFSGLLYFVFFWERKESVPPIIKVADTIFYKVPNLWFDLILFGIGFILLSLIKELVFKGISVVIDTNSQIVQARILASGKWYITNPFEDKELVLFSMGSQGEKLYSQFPPGYIIVLLVFYLFHGLEFAGPFIGALTLIAIRWAGELIGGRTLARLAPLLIFFSPFWIIMSAEGMNHALTLLLFTLLLGAILKMYRMKSVKTGYSWPALTGFLVSWIFVTRPLNGVVYSLCLVPVLWKIYKSRGNKDFIYLITWLIIGAVPFIAFLLFYNYKTTGSPFLLGYIACNPAQHRLGFNFTGVEDYTLKIAFERVYASAISLAQWLFCWPFFGLIPFFLWWIKQRKTKTELFLAFLIIAQITAYFTYHFHDLFIGPRFWYETITPITILSAIALAPLVEKKTIESEDPLANTKEIKVRTWTLLILLFFGFHSIFFGLPKKTEKYASMICRGAIVKKAFEKNIRFPPHSFLLLPDYYQEWNWVFGPKIDETYYYLRDDEDEKIQLLKKQYPTWHFYRLNKITASWDKL